MSVDPPDPHEMVREYDLRVQNVRVDGNGLVTVEMVGRMPAEKRTVRTIGRSPIETSTSGSRYTVTGINWGTMPSESVRYREGLKDEPDDSGAEFGLGQSFDEVADWLSL